MNLSEKIENFRENVKKITDRQTYRQVLDTVYRIAH